MKLRYSSELGLVDASRCDQFFLDGQAESKQVSFLSDVADIHLTCLKYWIYDAARRARPMYY